MSIRHVDRVAQKVIPMIVLPRDIQRVIPMLVLPRDIQRVINVTEVHETEDYNKKNVIKLVKIKL